MLVPGERGHHLTLMKSQECGKYELTVSGHTHVLYRIELPFYATRVKPKAAYGYQETGRKGSDTPRSNQLTRP